MATNAQYMTSLDEEEIVTSDDVAEHSNQPFSIKESSFEFEPPFEEMYKHLFHNSSELAPKVDNHEQLVNVEEIELPMIDLGQLNSSEFERKECKQQIAKAAQEWGFFQVVGHKISNDILDKIRLEQINLFRKPFHEKINSKNLSLLARNYIWGAPSATCLRQLSWMESFHIPLGDFLSSTNLTGLRYDAISSTIGQLSTEMFELANLLAKILDKKLGHHKSNFFIESSSQFNCYLRMNRYPPCPLPRGMFGLVPHTDSSFLTILLQDRQIGGLQFVKDGKWVAGKLNSDSLIIIIGDLFQALSNNTYRSIDHRVITNKLKERFSTSYFLCPSYETIIKSCVEPSVYRKFSFQEYRKQVEEDVKTFGYKVGLSRFR